MSKKMGYFFAGLGIAAMMVTAGLGELEYKSFSGVSVFIKVTSLLLFLIGMTIIYHSELKLRFCTIAIIIMKVFRHKRAANLVARYGGCSNFYRWAVYHER